METPQSNLEAQDLKPYLAMAHELENKARDLAKLAVKKQMIEAFQPTGFNRYLKPPSNKFYSTQYEYHGSHGH